MAPPGRSRDRGRRRQKGAPFRLTPALRNLLATALGRQAAVNPRHGKSGRYAHPALQSARSPWLVKQEVSIRTLGLAIAGALFLAWTGWHIIADTAALSLAKVSPDVAIRWAPAESTVLDQLALQEMVKRDGDVGAAEDWARRALRSRPIDNSALFWLGVVAQKKGENEKAAKLMRIAGERTWRNVGNQLWLFEDDSRHAKFADALAHADAMIRVVPASNTQFFPALAAFTTDPRGLRAVADFLINDPPAWRTWFLSSLSTQLYNKAHLDQLYALLRDSQRPPTEPELNAYLRRLIRDGRFQFAHDIWRGGLPPKQRADRGLLFNGNFEFPVDTFPFNWVLYQALGADIAVVPSAGSGGRALEVQFSGTRVDFANVEQLVLLPAGRYRLSGRVKADLRTPRGLWWQISCASGSKAELGHTRLVVGNVPWSDFAVEFDVPADGCPAQILQLRLPARIASEKQIDGQVWYENLRIAPSGGPGGE